MGVKVKCIVCNERRTINAGEVPAGGHPVCSKDGSPMIPIGTATPTPPKGAPARRDGKKARKGALAGAR